MALSNAESRCVLFKLSFDDAVRKGCESNILLGQITLVEHNMLEALILSRVTSDNAITDIDGQLKMCANKGENGNLVLQADKELHGCMWRSC